MSKQKSRSEKTTEFTENGRQGVDEFVRSAQDRTEDPLFVPHLDDLIVTTESTANDLDRYPALLETICGVADDSQPVEQYNGSLGVTTAFVAAHQSAACQVQWNNNLGSIFTNPGNVSGVRWGSGTMIANDLFLTCGHLFDQTGGDWQRPRINGTTNIISPQDIARNMHLNFNFQVDSAGNMRAEQSFPITELIEYRLGGIDMAVCRVGGNPGAIFGRTTVSPTDAAVPDMICIIGHPAGQPKRIEAGPTTSITGNRINYSDIDTLGGNSGSGILRASDGRLVGIHTNGGCGPSSPGPGGGSNFGQRIAAVIAVSPTLQNLLQPVVSLKFRDDLKLKFVDDGTTIKFTDDGVKFKAQDDITKFKFRDDVKLPALDKRPGQEGKLPAFDNKPGFDNPGFDPGFDPGRGIRREAQPVRPFILSTPHHSNAWQRGMPPGSSEQAEIETTLSQYEQAMTAAEAELQQLDSQYRELLTYYESIKQTGQQQ